MPTSVLVVDPVHPQPALIARAAECLRAGGLVAFPTETVYGLGVHALDRDAVRRLFAAKGRPATDPLIVHVASVEDARALVIDLPAVARLLANRFWPGPLTLVLRRAPVVPNEVTAGLDTVAIRLPAHPIARALLAAAAVPVAAPSANLFSRPSPTRAAHVLADLEDRIDMVIDGGPTAVGLESTVLDLSVQPPVVLRPGAITTDMLRPLLPDVIATRRGNETGAMPSPGMLERHYAPTTPLTVLRCSPERAVAAMLARSRELLADGRRLVLLAPSEDVDALTAALRDRERWRIVPFGQRADPEGTAQALYAALRDADAMGADALLVCDTSASTGLGVAITDRLRRAAARIEDA